MTKVLVRPRTFARSLALLVLLTAGVLPIFGQTPPVAPSSAADALYSDLRTVGLDPSRVYRVRDISLDRPGLHISFENGSIAFTRDVYNRVTGAFFEGDGEVIVSPPNRVERASMALFTGMAILEEQFSTGYFRFNDNTFSELQPNLRPAEHAPEFVTEYNEAAVHLAEMDALRLLVTFSHFLPTPGPQTPALPNGTQDNRDRMLHSRLQGKKLGAFDLFYDSTVSEQVWAGQSRVVASGTYYDLWTSFASSTGRNTEPAAKADDVAVSRYDIAAEVKPPTTLNADARLKVKVNEGGQRTLLFELSRVLQIKTLEFNGRPIPYIHNPALEGSQVSRRGNDLVAVIFPKTLQPGETFELHFAYGGDVLSDAGRGLLYVGARGTWYPNRGFAMADFDLAFRYPAEWTLVATGKRAEGTTSSGPSFPAPLPPGMQQSRWVSERAIPVAGFNLGKYVHAVARAGQVAVESFATPGMERAFNAPQLPQLPLPEIRHPGMPLQLPPPAPPAPSPGRNAQPVAQRSASALEFFASRFGPFPYDSLKLTQMPGDLSQGWPGLIFLSSYAFLSPEEKKQLHVSQLANIISGQVLVHETAHQWWGDLVTWSSYRDQWLFEGLANYCSMLMLRSEDPAEFHQVMEKYRIDLLEKNKDGTRLTDAGPVSLGLRLSSSRFPNGYEAISYGRGAWLFYMLHEMMKDAEASAGGKRSSTPENDPFIRSLRKARDRYQGKIMSTGDLIQVFEEDLPRSLHFEGRKSLDWFVDGWINGTSMPRYDLKNLSFTPKQASTLVTGTLLQKDAPDDLVTPVPLYAVVRGRPPIFLSRVFADGAETTFRLTAPVGTRKIVVDPHEVLLLQTR